MHHVIFTAEAIQMHSRPLMLARIADVIEVAGLQVGAGHGDLGQGGLAEDIGGDVLDRCVHDFVNEADIPVFARRDSGDDLASSDSQSIGLCAMNSRRRRRPAPTRCCGSGKADRACPLKTGPSYAPSAGLAAPRAAGAVLMSITTEGRPQHTTKGRFP